MNLRRHLDVLWRFRFIVIAGAVLGVVMGTLALFQVSGSGLQWRAQETWQSQSTLYVTQPGFPDGRVILSGSAAPGAAPTEQDGSNEQFADPGRFANLAIVYSSFMQSERVRAMMRPQPMPGQVQMTPVPAAVNSPQTLPIVTLTTSANNGGEATRLNSSAIGALQDYLEDEQEKNKISADNRVRVEVLNPPSAASILLGRSKTPGIVAFVLCLAAAIGLAYCLDNLRPRPEPELGADVEPFPPFPSAAIDRPILDDAEERWGREPAHDVPAKRRAG